MRKMHYNSDDTFICPWAKCKATFKCNAYSDQNSFAFGVQQHIDRHGPGKFCCAYCNKIGHTKRCLLAHVLNDHSAANQKFSSCMKVSDLKGAGAMEKIEEMPDGRSVIKIFLLERPI
ncbi:MAG: hypothetical protein H7A36_00155 [Chlamydiales bacterium]|nr:hypothetical protein [Chlamydiales bacterium]